MVIKKLLVLAVVLLGACNFQERDFKDLTCQSDQDCARPDQECRNNLCTQRECSATTPCPTGHSFTCTADGLCVAAECTETTDCANGYACSNDFCQASFNVTAVTAVSNTSVAITFDSPPEAASATTLANYVIDGLTVSGTPTLNGSTVTLTTSPQTATTYMVSVANVVRDFDKASLIIGNAMFVGRGAFDVTSAASTSAVTVAVTFSEAPDPVDATNPANYAFDNGLSVTSTAPVLSGNVVTLTTGTQTGITYTVTVTNVHRASDDEALTTHTAMFLGRTDFNVASVTPKSNTSVAVTFDAAPNPAQAVVLANYSIPGLTLSGTPSVSGSTVTLTTSPQVAQTYTLSVSGVTRASDSEPLTIASMDFTGRDPFNVADANSRSTHQISVTFDAAPEPTAATTLANYSVNGLVLSGTPVLAGNVVTIDTSTQSATTYTVTVSNVKRASDMEALTANAASFTGRAPFDVATAVATSSTTVTVTFDSPPNSGQASLAGNYTIAGLTVLSASTPSGNSVTLTTTPMQATSYMVTVAGVTRASDGEALLTNSASFTGRAPFDVASAAAPTSGTITVTFDAPPTAAAATTLANYSVPGLTLSGTPVLSGSTVTLQTGAQLAQTYTVTVSNVTRASDGEPLTMNSASFTGRTHFNVQSASSGSNVSVRVTFDAPPNPTQATTLANYSVPGLTLSGTPTLSGNTVTLTTSNQTGSASYTITVSGVTRNSDGEPLATVDATFTGLTGFNVTGASSLNTTSVQVVFDAPPTAGAAQTAANYTITGNGGLTVSSAVLSGSTVTLTTSAQSAGTYTVTVSSNVTRASDSSPLVVSSAQFSYVSFNVTGATALTNHSASVSFDAPPNATQAATQANYTVACSPQPCTNVTLSSPVLSGSTVTLTTTAQQAGKTYTITVNNVTRASDGSTLANKTGAFVGRSSFNVASAAAPTSGTITVTFDGTPDVTRATTLANYSVSGLALSGTPLLVGNTVTLNTTVQAATTYTVTVSNVTRAADAEPLTVNTAMFTGKAQTNPTVSNVVVQSTVPDNATTFFNTGTATVVITGTEFNGVNCLTGVKLDDLDGNGTLVNTKPSSCTVDSATQITATFPSGIRSNYTGWNVQVTNSVGTNATSTVKLVIKAGLLVSEIFVGANSGGDLREWLEVYNPTATTLNLDTVGIVFHYRDGAGADTTLSLTTTGSACGGGLCTKDIPAGKFWMVTSTQSSADTWYSHRNALYTAATASQLVPNGGVYMSLSTTAQSKVIDKVGWGSQAAAGREGTAIANFGNDNKSAQRKPGNTSATTDTDANSTDFSGPNTTTTPKGTRD